MHDRVLFCVELLGLNMRGIVDTAQHDLCPDTLHWGNRAARYRVLLVDRSLLTLLRAAQSHVSLQRRCGNPEAVR